MKTRGKRTALTVLFLTAFSMGGAFAQTEADFNVTLTDDGAGVQITGYTGKATAVKIPATIQGMPVQKIGDNVFRRIMDYGDFDKIEITAITLPAGLLKIGDAAFAGQTKLTSVVIPDSVVEIGSTAFYNCYDNGERNFKNVPPTGLKSVTLPKSLAIAGSAIFSRCELLSTVTIPQGVKVIGDKMFDYCPALKSIVIPDSVTEIGESAFGSSNSYNPNAGNGLVSITLGKGIQSIPYYAFYGCQYLQSVVIPEGVTEIQRYAFTDCKAMTSLSLPSTIETIDQGAFVRCSALVTITIPDSVTSIEFGKYDQGCFDGCSKSNLASQAALKRRGYKGGF